MNSWAWLGLSGIVVLTLLPLLKEENRTKGEIRKAIVTIAIVLGIIIAVVFLNVNYLLALLVGALAMILLDKKTYTKKRLIIYGAIVFVLVATGFFIFRDNPDYVVNHLKEHPETTSLYVAENGEPFITYQSDVVRPLASTVKILIAVEYAMQVDEGALDKESYVSLDDLNRYYYEGTDGGAHEAWLEGMESEGNITNRQVTLHDVAKGMIMYSSNANTDYLIDLLGIDSINQRAESLELTQHEAVYPIVAALLIPDYVKEDGMSEGEVIKTLESMPTEMYRDLAVDLNQGMKDGSINLEEVDFDMSLDLQRVWSDRLIGASANDYGRLLAIISHDELPEKVNETVRDLMEWPMEVNEGNHRLFSHLGAKGGSTAFILNDAMYAETHEGERIEMVLLTNDLNIWQSIMLSHNLNSFEAKLFDSEAYRLEVQEELSH